MKLLRIIFILSFASPLQLHSSDGQGAQIKAKVAETPMMKLRT